ncbi:MAG TPA: aminopeptidase P N-terminal domain-containing protein, partial [Saprospiraceae bacterium]|nr:aminopeptidase P N-terminal domain-containing protein [Saprospiraceae bacterium]
MKRIFSITLLFVSLYVFSQNEAPEKLLTPEFHKGRREAFRAMMPAKSVAFIFAYSERKFSNDVDYYYQPDPNLFYLSGYKEPNSLLILFKDMQGKGADAYNEVLYVQERNLFKEKWDGKRMGVEGAKEKLGFKRVFECKDFIKHDFDLSGFDMIIHDDIPADIMNKGTGYDLYAMVDKFVKLLPEDKGNAELRRWYKLISSNLSYDRLQLFVDNYLKKAPEAVQKDVLVVELMSNPKVARFNEIKKIIDQPTNGVDYFNYIANSLRKIKTPEEIAVLRKAIWISAMSHNEVMKALHPEMTESEAYGIHLYIHRKYGSENEGYHPIVGAGGNACILHYITNDKTKVGNDILLMDVGAQYSMYTGDITRSIPGSGKFSPEQKAIYEIVHKALEELKKISKPGTTFTEINMKSKEILTDGMLALGLIKNRNEISQYY